MKILVLLISITFLVQNLVAQDKILTRDGQELTVKIVEQTDKLIKYKFIDIDDSPIISLKNRRVERIEYRNGVIDRLGNQNPRYYRPFGLNAGLSSEFFLLNSGYFIIPQVELQLNLGWDFLDVSYYSVGSRFHLNSKNSERKLTPFTGILIGSEYGYGFIQIPIGLNFIAQNGFNASLSLNEMIFLKENSQFTFVELTLGWKFKI